MFHYSVLGSRWFLKLKIVLIDWLLKLSNFFTVKACWHLSWTQVILLYQRMISANLSFLFLKLFLLSNNFNFPVFNYLKTKHVTIELLGTPSPLSEICCRWIASIVVILCAFFVSSLCLYHRTESALLKFLFCHLLLQIFDGLLLPLLRSLSLLVESDMSLGSVKRLALVHWSLLVWYLAQTLIGNFISEHFESRFSSSGSITRDKGWWSKISYALSLI